MAAWIDEMLPFPGHPGIPERPPRLEEIEPFFTAVRARRFDLAIQMYGAPPVLNRVTARLGARRTAGFFSPGEWAADLGSHLPYPEHQHEIRRHLALMDLLGAAPRGERLEFPIEPEDEVECADLLRRTRLAEGAYACLHPGATSPSRLWPAERFAAVGDALAARGLRVAVTGVRGEEGLTSAVACRMGARAVDLCGATSLGSFAALLRRARLLVANDTGAAHLAAATRTPSVTAFLSGDPRRWAGLDPVRHRVARVQVECNPCRHLACPIDHRCARRLTVGEVLAHVDAVLTH
jgi:ADP-heptose:LPS heptosyltransferase